MPLPSDPFSERGAQVVRALRHQPGATVQFEWSSGGLVWSDEMPANPQCVPGRELLWVLVELWAFRASLIRGEPMESLRKTWSQLEANFPDCPIVRFERRNAGLLPLLEQSSARMAQELEDLECPRQDEGKAAHGSV